MVLTIENKSLLNLDKVVQRFGYTSVLDFTRIQVQILIREKIAFYKGQVSIYEKKYGMDFEEFRRRVVEKTDPVLSKFGVIEKEDDDMEWELALEMCISLNRTLEGTK